MSEVGKIILNGKRISYTDFFHAYGYGLEDSIYIRVFYDDEADKEEYKKKHLEKLGCKPTKSFNPLGTKFNKVCKLKDFDALCMKELFVLNANNYGIFFAINGGHSEKEVKEKSFPRAQFMEMDEHSLDEQMEIINSFALKPSIIVKTKKSLHCYWLLSDGDFQTWKKIQKRLIAKFNSDQKISDASRVMRVPGFNHCKDKDNPVLCTLVEFEPDRKYKQEELLEVLDEAENENETENSSGNDTAAYIDFDSADEMEQAGSKKFKNMCKYVEQFLIENNIPCKKGKYTKEDGTRTMAYWLTDENTIPWHDEYTTAWKPEDTLIMVHYDTGIIGLSGRHSHDVSHGWKDLLLSYRPPDRGDKQTENKEQPKQFDIKLIQGRVLQAADLPPIIYPVANMIPQGYTVVSAPFKYGKSWFSLEMCLAVADGAEFLGQPTTKGSAVYLALEDCDQFAQERLNIALNNREAPEGFYYIMEGVPTLDDGFIDYLNQLYRELPDLKLVVVDILAKVEYQAKKGESAYKCDYRTGGALKKWADDHLISLVVITHTTKMVHPNDIFMNTTGSSGVSGAADALVTIAKEKRTDKDALLAITGRRVREKYFKVHLKDGYLWETDGEVDPDTMQADQAKQEQEARLAEYRSNPIREALVKIANTGIDAELSSKDIIDKASEQNIHLLNTPKEVGGFICKYQNYLFVEDSIKVYIRKRGTGSNVYKVKVWEQADDETEDVFE